MSENGVCVCVRWRKKEVKIRGDLGGGVSRCEERRDEKNGDDNDDNDNDDKLWWLSLIMRFKVNIMTETVVAVQQGEAASN